MKIRGSHIAMATIALIGAFALLAILQARQSREPESEKDFIDQVRQVAKDVRLDQGTGQLPPAGREFLVPIIEVETAALELGPLTNKTNSASEVKVFNRGKTNLNISDVKTNCLCTQGKMETADIPPGGAGKLIVTIDPFRIFGFDSNKTLTLYTNDPARATVDISVKATIQPEFSLDPVNIDFGELPKGTPAQATMILRQLEDEPIAIEKIEPVGDLMLADLTFSERPKDQWARPDRAEFIIHADLRQDIVPGAHAQSFRIYVQCKRFPYFTSRASAKINAFYRVTPERLVIAKSISQRFSSATIEADQPFELLDVHTENALLTVTTKPGPQPNTVLIEPQVPQSTNSGDQADAILFTIKAGDSVFPNRLPVHFSVSKALSRGVQ